MRRSRPPSFFLRWLLAAPLPSHNQTELANVMPAMNVAITMLRVDAVSSSLDGDGFSFPTFSALQFQSPRIMSSSSSSASSVVDFVNSCVWIVNNILR